MTVKELIEKLEAFPEDMNVAIYSDAMDSAYFTNIDLDRITVDENCPQVNGYDVIHPWRENVSKKEIVEIHP